jgi:NhaP-type Na+/H+ or K+/H+ antiporter
MTKQQEEQLLMGLIIGLILGSLIGYLISTIDTWNILTSTNI